MKDKRAEEWENKVDILIDEFKRKVRESVPLLANPALKRCRVIVGLDPARRVPISRNTRFEPLPKVLDDEYDDTLLKLRNNAVMEYLLEGREQIVSAWESGAIGYVLRMHDVPTIDEQTRWSIQLECHDANGRKLRFGLM
jgi:hypothetical protein